MEFQTPRRMGGHVAWIREKSWIPILENTEKGELWTVRENIINNSLITQSKSDMSISLICLECKLSFIHFHDKQAQKSISQSVPALPQIEINNTTNDEKQHFGKV